MIFTKIRTLNKKLAQLKGRLKTYVKLAKIFKRYIIQLLDLDEKIQHLLRVQRSFDGLEIVDVVAGDHFIVRSKAAHYIVRPTHFNPKERCDCNDCYHRGRKCQHQIAVERFCKNSELSSMFGVDSSLMG
ncbi:MAG: hypothetical protein MJK14_20610 [Rivularia sp. ALOHA_DT_140]|nr:hypothetical protein [Rivularia sp. ALOHA_DT_140]